MKKSRLLSAFAGIALLIAGCSDLNDSGVVSGDVTDKSAQAQSKMITVNVTSESDLLTFPGASGASRTILPQAVNASDNTAVKFYLEYKDTLSNSPVSNPEEIAFTADTGSTTKGTLTKTFDVSVYSFTLYCVPASAAISNSTTAKSNAMFIGYANADLRYADTISFYMTAENATGKGTVDLSIYTSNENSTTNLWNVPEGYTVTAGIYSKADNSLVYPPTPKPLVATSPLQTASAINGAAFGAASTTVDSGSYNFVVIFTDTANGNKSYEWSDEIIILPNQRTSGNVFVPEVIEKKPDAPSSFFVAYADPKNKDDNYYYAEFAWSDNSNNERSFEIDLVDVSDDADNTQGNATPYLTSPVPANDSDWSSMLTSYTNPTPVTYDWEAYQKSPYNPNSAKYSLIKNNENALFHLELGRRYLARIRAKNDVGYSEYAYLHIAAKKADGTYETGFADGTGTIEFTEDAAAPDAKSSITVANEFYSARATTATALTMKVFDEGSFAVNRFRITYNLMDGKLVGDEDAATPGTYTALADDASDVVYKTQHVGATGDPSGEYIMNPDGNSAKSKYLGTDGTEKEDVLNLIKTDPSGTRKFKRWLLSSGNDEGNGVSPTGNWYPVTVTGTAPATRDEPDAYTGHTNLELYASYAVDSTLNVEIADYTAFNWDDGDVVLNYIKEGDTTASDETCKSGGYVQVSASTTGTITFKLQESTKEYDNVSLVIRSTSQKSGEKGYSVDWVRTNATYDDTATPPAWSASPAAFDVNVKPFKPGKYECYLIGTSKKYPNKQYKYTLTIDLVD